MDKIIRRVLIGMTLGAAALLFCSCSGKPVAGEITYIEGLKYDSVESADENLKLINRAIASMGEGSVLQLEEGRLYIAASKISGGIRISGKNDITVSGNGTVIVNSSYDPLDSAGPDVYQKSSIFQIIDSSDIVLSGLTLDYYRHTNASGVITGQKGEYTYFKVFDEYISGDKVPLCGGEYSYSLNCFDTDGKPTHEYWMSDETAQKIERCDENGMFRVFGNHGNAGDKICVRFTSNACPAIYVYNTHGLEIRDVVSRSCPSATFYAPCGNSDFTFERFAVKPEEASLNLYASNVDCIHIKGLRGKLKIKDCVFEGIGDDALNVHSRAAVITDIDGLSVSAKDGWTRGSLEKLWADKGDTVEFFDENFCSLGTAEVKKFSHSRAEFESLPEKVGEAYVMQNISYCPETSVENCTIERGRARGLLIQTGNASVKNCTFKNLGLPAILVSPDISYWYELGPTENLTVSDNTFENCCTLYGDMFGAIEISLGHDSQKSVKMSYPHKDIVITNNKFSFCGSYDISASYADGLYIAGNVFDTDGGKVRIKDCINVRE